VAAILTAALFGAAPSHAGVVIPYTDYASWAAAVSGVTTVTIPQPVDLNLGYDFFGAGTASVTYSGVVFSSSSTLGDGYLFNIGTVFSEVPPVLSSQETSFGVENILISLPWDVTGFALNYGTFNAGRVTFQLSNGDSVTQGSTGSGYSVPDFLGVTDSTSFNWVLVTSSDPVLNLNDVSYNGVPEPAVWLLLAGGLAGLLVHGRRRAKSA